MRESPERYGRGDRVGDARGRIRGERRVGNASYDRGAREGR